MNKSKMYIFRFDDSAVLGDIAIVFADTFEEAFEIYKQKRLTDEIPLNIIRTLKM